MSYSRKRRSFDTSYKLKVIQCVEKSSKEAAARKFGVNAKRIRVWCSQKEQLIALKKDGKLKRKG